MKEILILLIIFSGLKDFLKKEIKRNFDYLIKTQEVKPYFILYRVKEIELYYIEYGKEGLIGERKVFTRIPYVELRVGDYKSDGVNTGSFGSFFATDSDFRYLLYPKFPIEDKEYAISHTLWKMTDFAYKNAVKDFYEKRKKSEVFIPDDTSSSFSKEKASKYTGFYERVEMDSKRVKDILGKFSSKVLNQEFLYTGKISFYFIRERRTILNTEGTEIEDEKSYFLLKVLISGFDGEGKYYRNSKEIFGYTLDDVLGRESLFEVKNFVDEFKEYLSGNEIESYKGKAILESVSSAKFISNLVRNTLCIHKENYENLENFIKKIGKRITGEITIYDKPQIKFFEKKPLAGFTIYDDEGVSSKEIILIDNGILKNFLLKREPINGFENSNGHARSSLYSKPFPFITNLFVQGENKVLDEDSILIIRDFEFKSPLSLEVKKGFILYKDGRKKEIKNLLISFSSFEEMWSRIEGVKGNLKPFNFFEENPYLPFSVVAPDIILNEVMAKSFLKKKIRND